MQIHDFTLVVLWYSQSWQMENTSVGWLPALLQGNICWFWLLKNCIQDETDYQKEDSSFCKNWTQNGILNKIATGAPVIHWQLNRQFQSQLGRSGSPILIMCGTETISICFSQSNLEVLIKNHPTSKNTGSISFVILIMRESNN